MNAILLIEDEAELRQILKTSLVKRRYKVIEAANGREAIHRFKPDITDLVVTDLIMPEEDGIKVIMRLREIKPELKIIAISGGGKAGPGSYLKMAKTLGADAILSKPFALSELLEKIDQLLGPEQGDE